MSFFLREDEDDTFVQAAGLGLPPPPPPPPPPPSFVVRPRKDCLGILYYAYNVVCVFSSLYAWLPHRPAYNSLLVDFFFKRWEIF